MTGFIVSIALAIIMMAVLKNTTYFQYKPREYNYEPYVRTEEKPIGIRLWWVVLIFLSCFLGWFSIISFIIFWILWGVKAGDEELNRLPGNTYWRLHGKSISKLINFLNKEL